MRPAGRTTAERELVKQDGRLLKAQDVLSHWKDEILTLRSKLLAIPKKQVPMFANISMAERYIKAEIHAALTEIPKQVALPQEENEATLNKLAEKLDAIPQDMDARQQRDGILILFDRVEAI